MAPWIEGQPADRKVASDSQSGHMPLTGPGPQLGVCKRQPVDVLLHIDGSLSFSLLPPKKINKQSKIERKDQQAEGEELDIKEEEN